MSVYLPFDVEPADGVPVAPPLPPGLLLAGTRGRLRKQLVTLMESIEAQCPSLCVAIWLVGPDGQRYSVREPRQTGLTHPCCSTALRCSTGSLYGIVTVCAEEQRGPSQRERGLIESVGWLADLLVENASVGEYRALLERVPAITYIADSGFDGRWYYVSSQVEAMLGFNDQEWCNDPMLWANQLHPGDRERVLAGEPEAVGADGAMLAAEYRMLHRDGRTIWVRDDAVLVRDDNGRRRWHGILLDITDRKRAELELVRRAAQQATVARLGEHALERVPIGKLLQEAVEGACEVLEVDGALVAQLVTDRRSCELRAACGAYAELVGHSAAQDAAHLQAVHTVRTGAPVLVGDWSTERRFGDPSSTLTKGVASSLTVAIEARDAPFGVLAVHAVRPREFSAGDVDFVQSLANVLADALERQSTEDAMAHRALHDPLTGLPNRVLFLDRLDKRLNGYAAGPAPARRCCSSILTTSSLSTTASDTTRATSCSARWPPGSTRQCGQPIRSHASAATSLACYWKRSPTSVRRWHGERIGSVFARPFAIAHNEHFVTTSVGIALARAGDLPQDLIRDADAAMYRAKERGRARYELFDEVMRGRAIARLRMENDLRRAIERDELGLAYQPIVSLRDGSIAGVEALLRWHHPERGSIPPGHFIPVAEESGLIERIGRWVLEAACRQAGEWASLAPDSRPIGISVNLSPLQLSHEGFLGVLSGVLEPQRA